MAKNKKRNGRPTIYSRELATLICQRISGGESLRKICRDDDMPERTTVHLWLLDKLKKDFFNQYEQACNIRAENMFDELNEIADLRDDAESPMRSRLRVDTRKWYLSKVMPKKFGDKLDMTSDGKRLPTPLLHVLRNNNSDKKDSEPNEEN